MMLLHSVSFRTKEDKHRQKNKKSSKGKGKCSFCFSDSLLNSGLEFNNILSMMKATVSFWLTWRGHIPCLGMHDPGQDSRPEMYLVTTPETHVLYCSQLCCLKRLLLSARIGWSLCSLVSLCVVWENLYQQQTISHHLFSNLY